ncbi:DUF262 domain-containing protein [Helicobacter pylori]|uniref:DUF262 domain-containing protein n=1 Tax=Helicobacter pylori TaxID=210 RepID=UPI001FD3282F|nr:DUF262 domain-containing protein [Helicobacter pylori]UOR50557.1 DUF262 domain-containing protein [Helicobacter pylori]
MVNESIEGKAYKLKDILATEFDAYYQIPIYQRPYQWTEKNCEKLLDDLFFNYEDDRESDYFCGSLVLITIGIDSETNAKTYDIVDGQQRLSTFILLAKVLVTLYDKDLNENYKISRGFLEKSLGDTDGEKRKRLIFDTIGLNAEKDFQYALTSFNDAPVNNNKNNYLKNAIYLKNYLRKKEIEDINDFIEWLYFKVIFIRTTCSNTSMALRIFTVLNARGLPLHATDIFKGELLKKLTEEKEQEELATRWENLRQKCLDNGFAMETLFSQHLTYLHPKTSKEKMKIRLNTQFDELQKSPLEYLDVVEDFYNAYCEVLEMQDRYAHLLSYKDDDYLCVILCTSLLHRYSESEIEALKELLVKFYYQHWVAGQAKSTREQTCCNIINALKEKKNIDDIISIARKNLGEYSVTQHFKEKLRDSLVYKKQPTKNPWIKPILILVEYFMSDDPKPKRIQTNDLHVERILPQKPNPSSQWAKDFSEEERERYTHSLANLTLLGGKKNTKALKEALSQASNQDFKEKKEIYMGKTIVLDNKKTFRVMTCYDMTKNDVCHYTEWTPKSLEKREKELIEIIESVLTL